ncbi:hypothetical protein [Pseudomonas sp. R5(2019)]|uniref:hypothetical protein n=1 Tax=Pseudomonas sp. R5(2019) TaxID=2697566 RepID=UPI001412FEE9|nr:hypothetical protein [Pseudomonas sp. R5(2019)]NBA96687.1 hypothetical protein [Pseudomonas sp. R5(2019)]
MSKLAVLMLVSVSCLSDSCGVSAQSAFDAMDGWYNSNTVVYYGQSRSLYGGPQSLRSPPLQPYISSAPATFIPVANAHEFADSRLPVVVDKRPRVLIRTYDPSLGVYIDTEVRDPR